MQKTLHFTMWSHWFSFTLCLSFRSKDYFYLRQGWWSKRTGVFFTRTQSACRSVYFHLPSWSWEIMWVALIQTSTSSSSALAPWSSNQPTAPAITCPAPNHTAQRRSVFNVMLVNPIWAPLSKRDWNWILYSLKEICDVCLRFKFFFDTNYKTSTLDTADTKYLKVCGLKSCSYEKSDTW